MTNLYEYLNEKKGFAYLESQIAPFSLLKTYPTIDNTRVLKGNSRIIGDADKEVQDKIIDMLITVSARYKLSYKEIAYVLLTTKIESGFNPDAAAGTTTAAGLPQGEVGFIKDALTLSKDILGFTLDLQHEDIFNAEKGCYGVVYSFLLNKSKVSKHYTSNQIDYWRWLYILHHDGAYSLTKYLDGKHKISHDGNKGADAIIEKLPTVESLLKSTQIATSFKLSTGDDTPISNKEYVAAVSLSPNSFYPSIVSTMNDPLIFIKGKTDSQGKSEAINALAGAEIVFTILKDNYKKLAMSGDFGSTDKSKDKKKNKKPPSQRTVEANSTYSVKSGDTLSAIAKSFDTTSAVLVDLNNLPNANILHIGQVLKLPDTTNNDTKDFTSADYISRYIPKDVKQAIMKYLGVENGNSKAAIAYSKSHIVLPIGSTSADVDKNKNVVHIKTTTKSSTIKKREKLPEKHKTDEKGTSKPTVAPGEFEPVINFSVSKSLKDLVNSKSLNIMKEIMKTAGVNKITITSTLRTVQKQVDAMYANMQSKGIQSQLNYYAAAGRDVIKAGVSAGGNDLAKAKEVKSAMVNKVINLQESGRLVSRHCVSEKMYATRNVFDISTHFSTDKSIQVAFDKALTDYARDNNGFKYISPFKHAGEPAFHVEIEQ